MKKKETTRGFNLFEFKDSNGVDCSIQQSSAVEPKIWLGSDKIGIKEFVAFRTPNAWEDRKEFDEPGTFSHHYVANNRMHLTQQNVIDLLPILTKFAETGEI